MQGLAMVAPVMSMGWGLAGGWEAVEVDGGSADAHSDKKESAYDGIAMVILHASLIAPPLVMAIFNVLSNIFVWTKAKRLERAERARAIAATAGGGLHDKKKSHKRRHSSDDDDDSSWSSWSLSSSSSSSAPPVLVRAKEALARTGSTRSLQSLKQVRKQVPLAGGPILRRDDDMKTKPARETQLKPSRYAGRRHSVAPSLAIGRVIF